MAIVENSNRIRNQNRQLIHNMSIKIKPSGDRVLIIADQADTVTSSGIIIPEMAIEKPQRGAIVAVGPGKYAQDTGELVSMNTKVGDHVLYGKHAGAEITLEGVEYLLMREPDIFAIL